MDINNYDEFIKALSDEAIARACSSLDFLELKLREKDPRAVGIIQLRELLIAGSEDDRVSALLVSSYFKELCARQRIAAFLVSIEISKAVEQTTLQSRLGTYILEQQLFVLSPSLYRSVRDGELLDVTAFGSIQDDGSVQIKEGWARLDPMLPPALVQTVMSEFPGAPLWVRLDPNVAHCNAQKNALMEAILVPANPKWWKNLGLFRGESTGGRYEIHPPNVPAEDLESYAEYHVKGLRKLETITQRKKVDYLTCMLEELQLFREGILIGRCIHLDTKDAIGTAPSEASVMHLDLAINVYIDANVQERLQSQLNKVEKIEASFRSHLLRVEGVPFGVLPAFCDAFFKSHVLLRDLISNQFSTV